MTRDGEDAKGGEDFASRWSRLKRGTQVPAAETPDSPAAPDEPPADERSDEEILRELGLPDPDTLKPGDDVKAFMASAVPARIRNRALRRLWASNPVLANLDRLVDYDDDFTDAATVPALLKTAYKVGRGWLDDEREEASAHGAGKRSEAEGRGLTETVAPGEDEPGDDAPGEDAQETERAVGSGAESAPADDQSGVEQTAAAAPRRAEAHRPAPRRRMRFRFADE